MKKLVKYFLVAIAFITIAVTGKQAFASEATTIVTIKGNYLNDGVVTNNLAYDIKSDKLGVSLPSGVWDDVSFEFDQEKYKVSLFIGGTAVELDSDEVFHNTYTISELYLHIYQKYDTYDYSIFSKQINIRNDSIELNEIFDYPTISFECENPTDEETVKKDMVYFLKYYYIKKYMSMSSGYCVVEITNISLEDKTTTIKISDCFGKQQIVKNLSFVAVKRNDVVNGDYFTISGKAYASGDMKDDYSITVKKDTAYCTTLFFENPKITFDENLYVLTLSCPSRPSAGTAVLTNGDTIDTDESFTQMVNIQVKSRTQNEELKTYSLFLRSDDNVKYSHSPLGSQIINIEVATDVTNRDEVAVGIINSIKTDYLASTYDKEMVEIVVSNIDTGNEQVTVEIIDPFGHICDTQEIRYKAETKKSADTKVALLFIGLGILAVISIFTAIWKFFHTHYYNISHK